MFGDFTIGCLGTLLYSLPVFIDAYRMSRPPNDNSPLIANVQKNSYYTFAYKTDKTYLAGVEFFKA